MRKIILFFVFALPLSLAAQGTWEVPETKKDATTKTSKAAAEDEYKWKKYLGDVVPMVDGQVEWQATFHNQLTAAENYSLMLDYLTQQTQAESSLPQSRVQLVNPTEHKLVCHFEEWMIFTSTLLILDRTRFIYTLACDCADNEVSVKLMRLSYVDDENNTVKGSIKHKAEEWITDRYAVNKKRTRLLKISGKYRRFTVDRMEEVLRMLKETIEKTK